MLSWALCSILDIQRSTGFETSSNLDSSVTTRSPAFSDCLGEIYHGMESVGEMWLKAAIKLIRHSILVRKTSSA